VTKFVEHKKVGQSVGRSTDTSAARCNPSGPSRGVAARRRAAWGGTPPLGLGVTSLRKNLRIGDLFITILLLSARTFVDHFRGFFSLRF
jgi:hypothetical protein